FQSGTRQGGPVFAKQRTRFLLARWLAVVTVITVGATVVQAQSSSSSDFPNKDDVQSGQETAGAQEADLFTGQFTYSIPIKCPAGRQGVQPQLALQYGSSSGNGWCGLGWSIPTGYIERSRTSGVPILWSPSTDSTPLESYDDAKGFVFSLDGHS